jgi:hypothetical protein
MTTEWDGLSYAERVDRWRREDDDLSRLWDGVALWAALTTIADMRREEHARQIRAEAGHP